jgi:CheY-like chemotaxis protein
MLHVTREKLLQVAVRSMDDLIFIFDLEGNFVDSFYPKIEDLFMEPSEFMGKNYREVLPPYLVVELDAAFSSLRNGSTLYEFRYKLEVNNQKQWYHGKMTNLFADDGAHLGFMGDIRRITRTVELEEGLLRKEKMLNAVAAASILLIEKSELREAVNSGLRLIGQATGVDRVYLFQNGYNKEKNFYFCSQKFEWSASTAIPQLDNPELQEIPFDDIGPFVYTLRNGKPFVHTVAELEEGRTKELLEAQDILSILVFPILVNSEFWGFVGFDDCRNERVWDQAEYHLLKSYAHSLSSAIGREAEVTALKKAHIAMEDSNREKSLFLSRAVAELSLPLENALAQVAQLPLLNNDDRILSKKQMVLQTISEALRTVQGLDDYVKMDSLLSNDLPISTPWMNWVNGVKDSSASFLPPHKLHIQLDSGIPDQVQVDGSRLKKILLYLINSVARKNNSLDVLWTVRKTFLNNTAWLDFEVLPCSPVTISFEKRTWDATSDKMIPNGYSVYQGEEIDIMVVNRLLGVFGSALFTDQNGLAYCFRLPMEPASVHVEAGGSLIAPEFAAYRGRIMVIEDNELNMFITSTLLQTWMPDATILEIFNAYDALTALENQLVDLVFVDIELPQRNGYHLAKKIRALEKSMGSSSAVPIVALTARYREQGREEAIAAGLSDFLAKPIDAEDLRRVLHKYALPS